MERLEKEEAEGPHPITTKAPKIERYSWTDKATGKVHRIPKGIDPGWAYNPGKAAWGKNLSTDAMDAWRSQGARAWETLTPGSWQTAARPQMIPADPPRASLGKKMTSVGAAQKALQEILGADERIFSFEKKGFRHSLLVNAETLAQHIDLNRSAFLPFITEALEDPYEIWLSFERHKGTGQVALRQRLIKGIRLEKEKGLLMVFQSRNGIMEAWTMMPISNLKYLNNQRRGTPIWAR